MGQLISGRTKFAECVQLFLVQVSILGFANFVKSQTPSFLQPFVASLFNETRTSGARDSPPGFIEKGGRAKSCTFGAAATGVARRVEPQRSLPRKLKVFSRAGGSYFLVFLAPKRPMNHGP